MRVVGYKAMSCGVNKSPDGLNLGLMPFEHPLLLITNPVVVLDKSKLLFLEPLVSLWSLIGVVIVQISMSGDRSLDVRFLSGRDEGCSSVIVTNDLNLSVSLAKICTFLLNVGLSFNHRCGHGPSSPFVLTRSTGAG